MKTLGLISRGLLKRSQSKILTSERRLPRIADAKNDDYLAAHHEQCTVGAAFPDPKQKLPQLLANERVLVSQPTRKWKRFQAGESFVELGRQSGGGVGRASDSQLRIWSRSR